MSAGWGAQVELLLHKYHVLFEEVQSAFCEEVQTSVTLQMVLAIHVDLLPTSLP